MLRLMLRACFSFSLLALALLAPLHAAGHEGQGPSLDVIGGQVRQGEEFELFADEFDPDAQAVLEMSAVGQVYPLGVVRTDSEGHFTVRLTVPQEVPDGYAELRARTTGGAAASFWILVGDAQDLNVGLPGSAPSQGEPGWLDPSVLILGIFVGGAGAGLLYLLFRPSARRPAHKPATVRVAEAPSRVVPRKTRNRARARRA